jgi:3-oxoacyl-[acyl-carrier protein] reductase
MPSLLVTGGARGLGAAIVQASAAQGHDVIFTCRASSAQEAEVLVQDLQAQYPQQRFEAIALDLADKAALQDFCADLEERDFYGLIHNAGQPCDALALMLTQEKAEEAMQVNFWSLTQIVKAVMRPMIRARQGRIIAIGSVVALQANPGNAAYAASKGALSAYMRTLAIESAARGVTVNVVAPGFIDTGMMAPYKAWRETMEAQIPIKRFCTPTDVAALVTFLLSPAAGAITGTVLPVDGGLTAMMGIHR